jgi:hypothetical protein
MREDDNNLVSAFAALDRLVTGALAATAGDGVDLATAEDAGNRFVTALADRFEQVLRAAIGDADDTTRSVDVLLRAVAALQAETLMLKASALGRTALPADCETRYRDPLALARALTRAQTPMAGRRESVAFAFDEKALCGGWTPVERDAAGAPWRWIGPLPHATLVLPALGPGRHAIEAVCRLVDASQADALRVACAGGEVARLAIEGGVGRDGVLRLDVDLPEDHRGDFMFLDFAIEGGMRRVPDGDHAPRGVGLSRFSIHASPGADAV